MRDKNFNELNRLTKTYPEFEPLALRARMVVLAAQRGDFSAMDRLTAKYPELTQLAFDTLPVSKSGKGKRFTEREIKRMQSAAPDRTIRISRDGGIELLPPAGKPDVGDVNPFNIEAERLRKLRQDRE